jgi:hypothetical protein
MKTCGLLLCFSAVLAAQSAEGFVVDAIGGAAIAGAYVSSSNGPNSLIARTDGSGHFRLQGSATAPLFNLQVTRTGYLRGGQGMQAGLGQDVTNLRISLTPEAIISGKVEDEDGYPVERAQVEAVRYLVVNGERKLQAAGRAESNDLGEYRISNLAAGRYYIRVYSGSLMNWDRRYVTQYFAGGLLPDDNHMVEARAGQERAEIDIRLSKYEGVSVAGRLEGMSNQPGRPQSVLLQANDGSFNTFFSSAQGGDNSFVIRHVPPGNYMLRASSGQNLSSPRAGDLMAELPVTVGATDVIGIVLTAHVVQAIDLAGSIVVDGGGTPPRMVLGLRAMTGAGASAHSEEDGSFVFKGLLPGHYNLQVQPDFKMVNGRMEGPQGPFGLPVSARLGEKEVLQDGFDLNGTPAGPLHIRLAQMAALTGKLIDAGGQPMAGVTVVFIPSQPGGRQGFSPTNPAGGFSTGMLPGDYHVYVLNDQSQGASLSDPEYLKAHQFDFPVVHVAAGANPPIVLQRAVK